MSDTVDVFFAPISGLLARVTITRGSWPPAYNGHDRTQWFIYFFSCFPPLPGWPVFGLVPPRPRLLGSVLPNGLDSGWSLGR
jgi:hypothetical protein